jgi:hypothetical protein
VEDDLEDHEPEVIHILLDLDGGGEDDLEETEPDEIGSQWQGIILAWLSKLRCFLTTWQCILS